MTDQPPTEQQLDEITAPTTAGSWGVYEYGNDGSVTDITAKVRRLRAELAAFEMLAPQQCPAGKHADWLVDSEYAHACPWCRIAELSAAVGPDAASEATSAPLSPVQPSGVSESAQSPTGAPEGALRASGLAAAEGSGR